MAESATCLFSLFYKSTTFCWYCECTNKSRPFTLPNDVLLLQCIRKVFTALHFFPTFCHVTALFQNRLNSLFFTKFYKQYPITTTWMKFVWNLCKFIKKKKRKKYSQPLPWHSKLSSRYIVSTDHAWDFSTAWLESTCGKFSWLIMIWKAHTCLYKVPQSIMHVRAQTKPWSPRNCL